MDNMQTSIQYQQQLQQQSRMQAHNRALQAWAARQQAMGDPIITQAGDGDNNVQETHLKQDTARSIDHQGNPTLSPQQPTPADQRQGLMNFQAICQTGSTSEVEHLLLTIQPTMQILTFGLEVALNSSNIEVAQYLLSRQAPIAPSTAEKILNTPPSHQINLFEALNAHGWTPNSPGTNGAPLLPKVVSNTGLLRWFLTHGANPNFGIERHNNGATDKLGYESCAALESASAKGDIEAVRMLLDAGAEIRYGYPLHYAAGALPAVVAGKQGGEGSRFDVDRIPIMQMLLERGADVNQKGETELVAHHPIMYAVMAGAVQRVRWLLERGADPEARGSWGSAAENAFVMGSEEMKAVMEVGIRARRLGGSASFAGESLAIRPKPRVG